MNTLERFLRKIDEFNMGKVTALSHFIQRLTGKNCFRQNEYVVLFGVCVLVAILTKTLLYDGDPYVLVACIIALLIMPKSMLNFNKESEDNTEENTLNILLLKNQAQRVSFLFLSILITIYNITKAKYIEETFYFWHLFLFCHLIAVTPLPPCNGKIKEFLSKLRGSSKKLASSPT